jgi:hypothetical protein
MFSGVIVTCEPKHINKMKMNESFGRKEPDLPPSAKLLVEAMARALTEDEKRKVTIRLGGKNEVELQGPEDLKQKVFDAAFPKP